MMNVSQLYVYPIKSMGGVALSSVNITDRGFEYDRRWMLIDEYDQFLTQRQLPSMALLQVEILKDGLAVYPRQGQRDKLFIPFQPKGDERVATNIWGVPCTPLLVGKEANDWFSSVLNCNCRLVYMDDETRVVVDERYNVNNSLTSFSDGYPILMISEASLQDLNTRTGMELPVNRFRPNIVIANAASYEEDSMQEFIINDITFYGVKPSARCMITTIDQSKAVAGKEPLKTLATYRSRNNKIYFGENVIASQKGTINVGDAITILKKKKTLFDLL